MDEKQAPKMSTGYLDPDKAKRYRKPKRKMRSDPICLPGYTPERMEAERMHGRVETYKAGCRCRFCRTEHARWCRMMREKQRHDYIEKYHKLP